MPHALTSPEIEAKVEALLSQMTLEEKAGQMRQSGISIVGTFGVSFEELLDMMFDGRISHEEFEAAMSNCERDLHEAEVQAGKLGSMNGICGWEVTNRLQKLAVEKSRMGIPLIFGSDVVHGYRTIFPIPLAQGCSWNPELVRQGARIAAREATADGINWTFAPMLDVAHDARWGRVSEGLGEDPLLTATLGQAMVEGFQNGDLSAPDSMAACPKHFIAYGAAEAGRDYNSVHMSIDTLRETYLPPFQAAVKAGCPTLMPSFNDLNGTPCTHSPLLDNLLRKELGFQGFLVSDANAVEECTNHGTAADSADAAAHSVAAGVDMEMNGPCYASIPELVQSGKLSIQQVDACVRRILRVKIAKGLFDHPYASEPQGEYLLLPEYRAAARLCAQRSAVLLKNENNLLPLKRGSKLALVGALADAKAEMLGAWAINGNGEDAVSLREALEKIQPIPYAAGANWRGSYEPEAVAQAVADADIVIALVGEAADQSGEAASRSDIRLPGQQEALLHQLHTLGKQVVCLICSGRPLALETVEPDCDAIMACWQLGIEAGTAMADLLFGDVSPAGHLAITFPRRTGQCPIYYNHLPTGRPAGRSKFTSKYLDVSAEPLYPFGHGLTYTTFQASSLFTQITDGTLTAKWQVTNTGSRTGIYTAQLYIRDLIAKKARPVKELKAFGQYELAPGEQIEISLSVPVSQMGYWLDGQYRVQPGDFRIFAGDSSETDLTLDLTLTKEALE